MRVSSSVGYDMAICPCAREPGKRSLDKYPGTEKKNLGRPLAASVKKVSLCRVGGSAPESVDVAARPGRRDHGPCPESAVRRG